MRIKRQKRQPEKAPPSATSVVRGYRAVEGVRPAARPESYPAEAVRLRGIPEAHALQGLPLRPGLQVPQPLSASPGSPE